MKLAQGQIWKDGESYYRIVKWARLAIEYKHLRDLDSGQGEVHQVSKKEFCRLIRGAELFDPNAGSATDEPCPASPPADGTTPLG